MAQPVKRIPKGQPNGVLTSSYIDPADYDPKMLGLMVAVISTWASVEAAQLSLYVHMLGGRSSTATATFMALESRSARTAAINAAAKTVLKTDQLELLATLLRHSKPIAKFRDTMAHWQLCARPSFKNHLTLRNPNVVEHSAKHPLDGVHKFSEKEMVENVLLANQCFIAFSVFRETLFLKHPKADERFFLIERALEVLSKPALLHERGPARLGEAPRLDTED